MSTLRRTMLFMPGNNPGMLQSAGILGADSIILDLEDAVSLTEKDSARILVREAIKNIDYSNVEVVVRINPLDTEFGPKDLEVIARVKPDVILLPKAEQKQMKVAHETLDRIEKEEGFEQGGIKIIALIETTFGLETVFDVIRASDRTVGVLLGGEDLTADLGVKRTKESDEIFYARNRVVTACKACKIHAIDTPFTDTDDYEGLEKDTRKARSLGMTGKSAINPRQIDTIHKVFAPTKEEIIHSQRVLDAMEQAKRDGKGVFSLDGKMVDAPIINRALNTISLAKTLGLA